MRENVVFKGSRDGLQLVLYDTADFTGVFEQLRAKLESAADFFRAGATVLLSSNEPDLTPEQKDELKKLFAEFGLTLKEPVREPDIPNIKEEIETQTGSHTDGYQEVLVVNRTLRGGQEVIYPGSVEIHGDVNPGAQVIAGGSIVIHGVCRGLAHAGAFGDVSATITAVQIVAPQLRIASIIARSPDVVNRPEHIAMEIARIKDGILVVEPAEKNRGF